MFKNYAQNMISLSREIEALKAAKVKAAKNLVVTSKNASISLTISATQPSLGSSRKTLQTACVLARSILIQLGKTELCLTSFSQLSQD